MATSSKSPARDRDVIPTLPVKHPAGTRQKTGQQRVNSLQSAGQQELLYPPAVSPKPLSSPGSSCAAADLRQLWLCVHLPQLPLEAVISTTEPAAVFEEVKGVRRILLANAQAMAAGIDAGVSVNAALALEPALILEARNPLLEVQALQQLADWSEKFTAFTSIEEPALLLLEIAGSRKLFGGIKPLRERIVGGLLSQGFVVDVAIAPTPLAATWLARAGQKVCIRDAHNLAGKLGPLPVTCMGWPDRINDALSGVGVTAIGEALRLPREGFAKRFGAKRLLEFDRALGRMPDPRSGYRSPERFVTDYDFEQEESDSELLLQACEELLKRLAQFLLHRQIALQHIEFIFFHLQAAATHLSLHCVKPDRAVEHWSQLLALKLERLVFDAPVIAIQLRGGKEQKFAVENNALPFDKGASQSEEVSIAHLAERLSARIGGDAVHGVQTLAEHRPQRAWRRQNVFGEVPHCASAPNYSYFSDAHLLSAEMQRANSLVLRRPLWMLDVPEALAVVQGMPCYRGALQLLDGPERLETGWWDGEGIARDYFVACNPAGLHLWIFRDRHGRGSLWYLHGLFG